MSSFLVIVVSTTLNGRRKRVEEIKTRQAIDDIILKNIDTGGRYDIFSTF